MPSPAMDGMAQPESVSILSMIWRALYYILFLPFSIFESDAEANKHGIYRRTHAATVYQQEMGVIGGSVSSSESQASVARSVPSVDSSVPEFSVRVVDGKTQVTQVAFRVPNRTPDVEYGGSDFPAPGRAANYPSLLLKEKVDEVKVKQQQGGVSQQGQQGRGAPSSSGRGPAPAAAAAQLRQGEQRTIPSYQEISPDLRVGIDEVMAGLPGQGPQSGQPQLRHVSSSGRGSGSSSSRGSTQQQQQRGGQQGRGSLHPMR